MITNDSDASISNQTRILGVNQTGLEPSPHDHVIFDANTAIAEDRDSATTTAIQPDTGPSGSSQADTEALQTSEPENKPPAAQASHLSKISIQAYGASSKRLLKLALRNRAIAAKGNEGSNLTDKKVTYIELVDALLGCATTWRPNTWRNHRSALKFFLQGQPLTLSIQAALDKLEANTPKSGYKGHKPNTVATMYSKKAVRKRSVPQRNLNRMIVYLESLDSPRGDKTANELATWLRAGLATGLRPCEWEYAAWSGYEQGLLEVKNAKRKGKPALAVMGNVDPARGLNSNRTVQISIGLDAGVHEQGKPETSGERYWVEKHLRNVAECLNQGLAFKTYYDRIRRFLHTSNQIVFSYPADFMTLYQLRGQFAANRKKSKGLTGAAFDLGINPDTASSYYGKSVYAHRQKGVLESENELSEEQIAEIMAGPKSAGGKQTSNTSVPASNHTVETTSEASGTDDSGAAQIPSSSEEGSRGISRGFFDEGPRM